MLQHYESFVSAVESYGILPLGGTLIKGIPTLQTLTDESQWHTGIPDTDPWQWKDRAAIEKRLAFGSILGGQKGFIAPSIYPLFLAVQQPPASLEEAWKDGLISQTVYQTWQLFNTGEVLSTAEIRQALPGMKQASITTALRDLQRQFLITVYGNKRKISRVGKEYGWPANTFGLVENWMPDTWRSPEIQTISQDDAKARLLLQLTARFSEADPKKLIQKLFGPL